MYTITHSKVLPIDVRVTSGIFNGYASSMHAGVSWVITYQKHGVYHIVDQQEIRTKNRRQAWIASLKIQAMMLSEFCEYLVVSDTSFRDYPSYRLHAILQNNLSAVLKIPWHKSQAESMGLWPDT